MYLLEHIHVNVNSLAATRSFLEQALPEIVMRGEGDAAGYGPWLHIGNDRSYLALTEVPGSKPAPELRHIGLVVEDIDAVMARLEAAGHVPADASELNAHPYRRRVYYVDGNGLDWEFVQYLTADIGKRNDYSL